MGLVVDAGKRLVTVDHSHNHYCVTTPDGNPVELLLTESLKVTSIFSRTKGKRDRSDPGDNSPMLYVIKGMHGLRTRPRDIAMMCASFRHILPVFMDKGFEWDWIIPLPSSSPVCSRFAAKVLQRTRRGACFPQALTKITAQQVWDNVGSLRISSKEKSQLRGEVKRFIHAHGGDTPFQIKSINVKLRHHIAPFMWGAVPLGTNPPRGILLIDDMVTSGTSLICAEAILKARYPGARVEALTLFGSSR